MLLMTTVDDLPAEGLPYIIERILDSGAKNVHVVNALTKKGRMEYIVFVDVDQEYLNDITSLFALEFGTLGIKAFHSEHIMLPYELLSKNIIIKAQEIEYSYEVQIKFLKKENKVVSLKSEYEDIKKMALDLDSKGIKIPFSKLKSIIEAESYKKILETDEIEIQVD
jgi:uncharacterized protein (DUF111 family)